MTVRCQNCSMKNVCICIPSADECIVRTQAYNQAINDFSDKIKAQNTSNDILKIIGNIAKELLK